MNGDAYAKAGVDYKDLQPFKDQMVAMGKTTFGFPLAAGAKVIDDVPHSHGAIFEIGGMMFVLTIEGLGNKNWIAEWMYLMTGDPRWFAGIGIDTILMASNDNIAQGAVPLIYVDEVTVGLGSWFRDSIRAEAIVQSFYNGLQGLGVALPAGETPALKFLLNPEAPVESAPSFSGAILGVIDPKSRLITGSKLAAGDSIIAVKSSGVHANGISLLIEEAKKLPDHFLTVLPNGNTFGEEALIPTVDYSPMVNALLEAGVDVHALLPGTGDGVGKLAFDKHPYTYRVTNWWPEDEIPLLFRFMRDHCGIGLLDCLKTFNWGGGYYVYVPADEEEEAVRVITEAGFDCLKVGLVEEGQRQTIFEPAGITLPPPGE